MKVECVKCECWCAPVCIMSEHYKRIIVTVTYRIPPFIHIMSQWECWYNTHHTPPPVSATATNPYTIRSVGPAPHEIRLNSTWVKIIVARDLNKISWCGTWVKQLLWGPSKDLLVGDMNKVSCYGTWVKQLLWDVSKDQLVRAWIRLVGGGPE
jgi:hypothetical protein